MLQSMEIVESVRWVSDPFKQANHKFHPQDTIVEVGGVPIGGGHFAMIAGPCSVESEDQIIAAAQAVKAGGANILRGGAFKPTPSIRKRQKSVNLKTMKNVTIKIKGRRDPCIVPRAVPVVEAAAAVAVYDLILGNHK